MFFRSAGNHQSLLLIFTFSALWPKLPPPMPNLTDLIWSGTGRIPLLIGAVLLYAASRAAVDALAGASDSPGKRAIAHWIPIAAVAVAAILLRRGDLALTIVFCTSVATLSLVFGSMILAGPVFDAPPAVRRLWPLVLPAALLPWLAGFAGHLTWIHAILFLLEGIVIWLVWSATLKSQRHGDNPPTSRLRGLNTALAAALAAIGGILAIRGAIRVAPTLSQLPDSVLIVALLGPLLIVPMVIEGIALGHRSRLSVVATTGIGVVLLNLCALLPLITLLWYPISVTHLDATAWLHVRFDGLAGATPLIFSLVTWRVDNVILVVLTLLMIPLAIRRLPLGWAEGTTLIMVYVAYVVLETAATLQI
jgi:Ca2+/Na+ antiporter